MGTKIWSLMMVTSGGCTNIGVWRRSKVHTYYNVTRASLLRCQRAQLALMERGR